MKWKDLSAILLGGILNIRRSGFRPIPGNGTLSENFYGAEAFEIVKKCFQWFRYGWDRNMWGVEPQRTLKMTADSDKKHYKKFVS